MNAAPTKLRNEANLRCEQVWQGSPRDEGSIVITQVKPWKAERMDRLMKFFALLYDYAPDYMEKRGAIRADHFKHARASLERGEFHMGGAFADPPDGAIITFQAEDRSVVEDFARNDPYVLNGLVTNWRVREWTVVLGGGVEPPPGL